MDSIQRVVDFLADENESQLVIKGSAGTGKTYLLGELINNDVLPFDTIFAASTNKAAKVLSEVIGKDVSTIFSILNLVPFDDYRTGKTKLKQTGPTEICPEVLIIDEAFMLTQDVLDYLYKAIDSESKIIFIGDGYQLPPVFYDESPVNKITNTLELTKIHRTKSPTIHKLVNDLRKNVDTLEFGKLHHDNDDVSIVGSQDFIYQMIDSFESKDNNHKVLAWTNQKVINYNNFINTLLNGKSELSIGDHITVNKPVFNHNELVMPVDGESIITGIQPHAEYVSATDMIDAFKVNLSSGARVIIPKNHKQLDVILKKFAKDKQWDYYFNLKNKFNDIRLTYSSTVHKSQGSTYDTVFIDISDICKNTKQLDVAKLMYVAASRASNKVIMCLDTSAIEKEAALHNLLGTYNAAHKGS